VRALRLLAFALAAAGTAPGYAAEPRDPLARGRDLTRLFHAGELTRLWPEIGPSLRTALGGPEGLASFRRRVDAQLGEELRVIGEDVARDGPLTTYTRRSDFERSAPPVETIWTLAADGTAQGLSVRPRPAAPAAAAPSRHLDRETRTPLRLPFEGEWTVVWGGRTLAQNHHAGTVDQRFGLDLVVTVDGAGHTSQGDANSDYHCWGRPVQAPAGGLVVVASDGIRDNTPGETNRRRPLGNHVVIDHMNGEYSFLAHLRNGSVHPRAGEEVTAGAPLGECGNSGHSSEPHLHYHLQDTPEFGAGEGLPAWFRSYEADGTPVERGEPARGQRIRPAPGR
jgi:murein DD-endopeptidase MepM/ murein hydrolase activator NlpD